MKAKNLNIRIEPELYAKLEHYAPEGNVSFWIRSLIRKEIERIEKEKESQ